MHDKTSDMCIRRKNCALSFSFELFLIDRSIKNVYLYLFETMHLITNQTYSHAPELNAYQELNAPNTQVTKQFKLI